MDVLIFFAIISLFVTVYTIFVSAQLKRERREIINRFNDVELNRYLEERYFTDQLIGLAPHQKLKLAESSVNDRIRISRRLSTSSFSIFIFVLLFTSVSTYKSSRSEVEGDVAKLVRGKIAYHIPDTMTINQPEEAFVSVSKSVNDSVLLSDISDTAFQKDSITVSSRMILRLIDPGEDNFTIKDINTPEQTVDDSSNTVWRWNVKAVKGGDNKVYLIATVKIFDKNGASNKDVKLIIKKIHVKAPFLVKAKQFTGDYWQYILSAFIIPFIGWAINKIRKSKKRKNVPVGFQIPPKKTDTKDKK